MVPEWGRQGCRYGSQGHVLLMHVRLSSPSVIAPTKAHALLSTLRSAMLADEAPVKDLTGTAFQLENNATVARRPGTAAADDQGVRPHGRPLSGMVPGIPATLFHPGRACSTPALRSLDKAARWSWRIANAREADCCCGPPSTPVHACVPRFLPFANCAKST